MAQILKIGVIPMDSLAGKLELFMPQVKTPTASGEGDADQSSFDLHSQATLLAPMCQADE
jgi:hypothetical protein